MGGGARQRLLVRHSHLDHHGGLPHARLAYVWVILCVPGVLAVDSARAYAQPSVGVGYERDRFTYHFANDSSIDTPTLVPHFFEQTYNADNLWLVAAARYGTGIEWRTAGGITPQRTGTGDDYDTFFDPGGIVFVAGTTGGISIWSWRVEQLALIPAGGIHVITGYRLRVDNADWQLGHKTIVRNGQLIDAHDTVDREFTRSQVQEVVTGVRAETAASRPWRVRLDAEISPLVTGKLLVQLPDKYPGLDLNFVSRGGATTGAFTIARTARPLPFAVCVQASRTWNYSDDAQLRRSTIGVHVSLGRT